MYASLSLFVKVAPVSGQVKYTPDTDRQEGSFTCTLDPWKMGEIIREGTDQRQLYTISMISLHTSAAEAFSFSASTTASASSSRFTTRNRKRRKSHSETIPKTKPFTRQQAKHRGQQEWALKNKDSLLHRGFALYLNCQTHLCFARCTAITQVFAPLWGLHKLPCRHVASKYNYDLWTQQKETTLLNREDAASVSDMRAGIIVSLISYTANSESWLDNIVALTLVPDGVLRGVNLGPLKLLNPGQGCSSSPLGSFAGSIAIIPGPGAALRCCSVGLDAAVP